MNRTIVRASRGVLLNRVVHLTSLPLELVASRGLSLMLMSRREVQGGFHGGLEMPTIDAVQSLSTAGPHFRQKQVISDAPAFVRNLLRPPS